MFGFKKIRTLRDVEIKLPFSETRKRARILVIDDDEQAFPYELLRKEGYNVTYWPRVENIKDLESGEYDVIILDIRGVADKSISKTDGLGILEHLKSYNPSQLIIAYSGQKFDLSHERFWKLADDYLGKPSPLITCKEKIDALLKNHFSPLHYWVVIENLLKESGASEINIRKFEDALVKSLKTGTSPKIESILPYVTFGHHSLALINSLISIILRLYEGTQ